jgi:anti-sigma B factor antagonist
MRELITVQTEKKVDTTTAPELNKKITDLLSRGEDNLKFDMQNTVYISSVGLRVFLTAQKAIKARKGSMILTNVSPQVMEVFDITGFSGLLTFE